MRRTALKVSLRRTSCRWTPRTATRWSSTGRRTGQRASSSWSSACGSTGCCGTARLSVAAIAAPSAGTTTLCSPTTASASCATSCWGLPAWKSAKRIFPCSTSHTRGGMCWKPSSKGYRIGTYSMHTTRWEAGVQNKWCRPLPPHPEVTADTYCELITLKSPKNGCYGNAMKSLQGICATCPLETQWNSTLCSIVTTVRNGRNHSESGLDLTHRVEIRQYSFPAALLRPPGYQAGVEHVPRLFQCHPPPPRNNPLILLSDEGGMRSRFLLTRQIYVYLVYEFLQVTGVIRS